MEGGEKGVTVSMSGRRLLPHLWCEALALFHCGEEGRVVELQQDLRCLPRQGELGGRRRDREGERGERERGERERGREGESEVRTADIPTHVPALLRDLAVPMPRERQATS